MTLIIGREKEENWLDNALKANDIKRFSCHTKPA